MIEIPSPIYTKRYCLTNDLARVHLETMIGFFKDAPTQTAPIPTRYRVPRRTDWIPGYCIFPNQRIPILFPAQTKLKPFKLLLFRPRTNHASYFDWRLFIAFAMVENTSRTSVVPRTASLTIVSTMPIWKSFRMRRSIIFPFLPATIRRVSWNSEWASMRVLHVWPTSGRQTYMNNRLD